METITRAARFPGTLMHVRIDAATWFDVELRYAAMRGRIPRWMKSAPLRGAMRPWKAEAPALT